jgi:hypothetical protein
VIISGTIRSDELAIYYIEDGDKKYRIHPDAFYHMGICLTDAEHFIGRKAEGVLDTIFKPPAFFTSYDGIISAKGFKLL